MNDEHQNIIDTLYRELAAGDMATYRKYYVDLKDEYFGFAKKFTTDSDIISDSYHDAFIALYENIVQRKLSVLTSSLKTYVFSIGKYSMLNKLRKAKREIPDAEIEIPAEELLQEDNNSKEVRVLNEALKLMSESCRKLIILFYYNRYSVEAIVREMEYKNANSAKAHKSRCMKRLREMMQERLSK